MNTLKKIYKNPLTYTITVDVLIALLFVAACFVISESILPGIVSAYISPVLLFGSVFILFVVIALIARTQDIFFSIKKKSTLLFVCGMLFFTALTAVASFRFGIALCTIFTIISAIVFILLYKIFHEEILDS